MTMLLLWTLLAWAARSQEECECTGSNLGIPNESPHQGTEFGKYCDKWDAMYEVCLEVNSPLWCQDKWCYVKEGCTVDGEVVAVESTYKDSGLFFSYEVCGNPNRFDVIEFQYNWEDCPERTKPLDIYFAIDNSGSIDEDEWYNMRFFISQLVYWGLDNPQDRVGIVSWSSVSRNSPETAYLDFSFDATVPIVSSQVMDLLQRKGQTWTDDAINFTLDVMALETFNDDAKKTLVLVTDGEPDKGHGPCDDGDTDIKQRLEDMGITFSVLAIDGANPKDFKGRLGCLVEDPDRDIVVMSNFYSFYEYRDPTNGDLCVNPSFFTPPDPTEVPTQSPTRVPSPNPSNPPSAQPTNLPTNEPTNQPTDLPTRKPTPRPTHDPSVHPTPAPTRFPSVKPSDQPSMRPTRRPTGPPTDMPTGMPTRKPTPMPSKSPTPLPTKRPTGPPTKRPTAPPSKSPSKLPTCSPTFTPTDRPTRRPTKRPTMRPSYIPTYMPTDRPTKRPSMMPSDLPTQKPTQLPTQSPTYKPTEKPTKRPSQEPTKRPSKQPTPLPTPKPSPRPTPMPTTPAPTECKRVEQKKALKQVDEEKKCGKKKKKRCNDCDYCVWTDLMCIHKNSGGEVCGHIVNEATCMDLRNCQWKNGVCDQVDPNRSGKRWLDTQGPHFWQTCAENFCMKHTWYGGMRQCHYDPTEHGCGCTGLDADECAANSECQFKNCECMERTPCEKLDFNQCLADARCEVWDEGCVPRCKLGPGQDLPDDVTLMLDQSTGKCKLHTVAVCPKKCQAAD